MTAVASLSRHSTSKSLAVSAASASCWDACIAGMNGAVGADNLVAVVKTISACVNTLHTSKISKCVSLCVGHLQVLQRQVHGGPQERGQRHPQAERERGGAFLLFSIPAARRSIVAMQHGLMFVRVCGALACRRLRSRLVCRRRYRRLTRSPSFAWPARNPVLRHPSMLGAFVTPSALQRRLA